MSEETGVDVWRGGVAAWECDQMGHMNVRFYAARAMEGLAGFAGEVGMANAFRSTANASLLVRGWHVRYLREARLGAPLRMTAGLLMMSEAEADVLLTLFHASSGDPCAAFRMRVVHVAPKEPRAFPWPERMRARAEDLQVTAPPWAEPRGLPPMGFEAPPPGPFPVETSREALRGVVQPGECDVFGRMRPDAFAARDSDAGMAMGQAGRDEAARLAGAPLPPTEGTAVIEHRVRFFASPKAGDHLRIVNAPTAVHARTFQVAQQASDPFTGETWAASETLIAAFDLAERRMKPVHEADRRVLEGRLAPPLLL